MVCDLQEQRKTAISRSVDIEELEKGVKHSISTVEVRSHFNALSA